MIRSEYVVKPEVLEKRQFPFTAHQLNQIRTAKMFHLDLKASVFISNGETHIQDLEVMY